MTETNTPTKRKQIDWEAVEMEYRAGVRSLKDIGTEFGVSDAGILKRAKRDGWDRDLTARIQAKAEAKVSAAIVSAEVSEARTIAEKQVVEINAQAVANVRLAHRTDIRRLRDHAMKLQNELETMEAATENKAPLATRTAIAKQIADIHKTLMGLEREAWGIQNSTEGSTPQTVTKIVREIVRKE